VHCHCPNRATALSSLLAIFLDNRNKQSELDADDVGNEMEPIIQGHTAVLFGLLMRDNLENQTSILGMLPGDTNKQKVAVLVDTAREFVEFYGEVMARVSRGRERGTGSRSHKRPRWMRKRTTLKSTRVSLLTTAGKGRPEMWSHSLSCSQTVVDRYIIMEL
jgi:hypothetical protein